MFLASLAPACDGNAFCPDCKTCPSLCPAGYVCKEATLIENGGAKSYHCGLAETKPALTGAARRLANAGAMDAVLVADSGGNAIRAVPVVKSTGNKQILGTELWNTDAALGEARDSVSGHRWLVLVAGFVAAAAAFAPAAVMPAGKA